ncbi:MAG TPA: NIL domain-containing protein [Bacteroidales bacterium]|mgnify:CR=1 FL=1|jgi:ferredoxin|nr:4Fe-4S dicluster domain-containing protein [Bacteroidales bacterium]HNR40705.1 NIL domain-containing protein [Bacteroidales bacterium]HPM17753.1 NIL domain-containing protein [Bacteroidales bacterium]HQG77771.1 NIL domain-containing protein [Bacteroidales bacterium]
MKSRRFVLTFPPETTGEPITYNLIRKFDIMVNIVKADVTPGHIGHLVMEMTAPPGILNEGLEYIRGQNVECVPIDRRITYRKDMCIHCGACSAVCFAGALTMDRTTAELTFEPEKCVVCELCLTACPLKLFSIDLG